MKALSVCNPYPELIMLPDPDPRMKRAENRTWPCMKAGLYPILAKPVRLLIHASKGKSFWQSPRYAFAGGPPLNYGFQEEKIAWGAIIGAVDLVACLSIEFIQTQDLGELNWLKQHQHANGPWCWIMINPRRMETPLPWKGAQGIFEVPDDVIRQHVRAT